MPLHDCVICMVARSSQRDGGVCRKLRSFYKDQGCRGGTVAVSVMMLSKSYGMFWFKPSPAPLNDLKKSATTDHTVCAYNKT